jgi:hypothetical protein
LSRIGRTPLAALAALALSATASARADEPSAAPVAPIESPQAPSAPGSAGAAAPPATAATPADAPQDDLRAAIEGLVGTTVHGTLTTRYRLRTTDDATDQDVYQFLDLRLGDEAKDRVSGRISARLAADLDRAHEDETGFVFESLDDTFDKSVNALLYTAYVNVRPESGAVEWFRAGRQYQYAAETFHFDGASAATRPIGGDLQLTFTGYGGVPVHFYESSARGDWIAGLRADAHPWSDARASFDWTHVRDRLSFLGAEQNDLFAVSLSQQVEKHLNLYGQFSWLDGARDATLRATANFPDDDLLVQASWYRLFEDQRELATEFDPYTNVLLDLVRYQQGTVRASKGFGDHFDLEIGAAARQLISSDDESPFNRNTRRVYVTPSVTDLPWKGTSISLTGESLTGDGERLQTWAVDVTHRVSSTLRVSAGSDYSLYSFGPLGRDERSHVRTAYLKVKSWLRKDVSVDVQYTWEKDDVETFHVLTLALTLGF